MLFIHIFIVFDLLEFEYTLIKQIIIVSSTMKLNMQFSPLLRFFKLPNFHIKDPLTINLDSSDKSNVCWYSMRVVQFELVIVFFTCNHEKTFFLVFSDTAYNLALKIVNLPFYEVTFIMNLKNRFLVNVCIKDMGKVSWNGEHMLIGDIIRQVDLNLISHLGSMSLAPTI